MWVLVRGGKVVMQADSYDDLVALRASARLKDTDRIIELPIR
jgi:hypothetical protein